MALAKSLDSNGAQLVPAYEEYLDAVQFADLPDETVKFVQAHPDHFHPSVLDSNGDPLPTPCQPNTTCMSMITCMHK
jgi:hypothetical protein